MDGNRFDAMTKGLAAPQSRRGVLKALAGAALGAAGLARVAADAAAAPAGKATICHWDADVGRYVQLSVSANALKGHGTHAMDILAPDFTSSATCGDCNTTCAAGETCQGGACVCVPATSCPAGQNCGTIPDGCGGTLSCGTCTGYDTCEGTGIPNVCGCLPGPSECGEGALGDSCASVNNCGDPIGCFCAVPHAECSSDQICVCAAGYVNCNGRCELPSQCACAPGSAPVGDGGSCTACPPGKFSSDGLACIDCPAGTFADSEGSQLCARCAPRTFTATEGSDSCQPCACAQGEGSATCCASGEVCDDDGACVSE